MGRSAENFSSLDSQGAILLRISSHHHFPFFGFERGSYFLSSLYINGRRNVETQTHFFFIVFENKGEKKASPSIRVLRTDSLSMVSLSDFIEQL